MTWRCEIDNRSAVCLFAYNRPSHLRRVLIALENYKIKKVYIFLDGPKNFKDKILQKEILIDILFKKNLIIKLIKKKKNLGLCKSIKTGLDYISKKYDKIIIIEDDCIPRKEFFSFINSNFKLNFKSDEVASICGYQCPNIHNKKSKRIITLLLNFFIPWGWAISSENWIDYRKNFKFKKKTNILLKKKIPEILLKLIKINRKNKNIWSVDFMLYNFLKKKKYLYPSKSLVKNIGFDGTGVNSKISDNFHTFYTASNKMEFSVVQKKEFINKQQKFILANIKYYY